VGRAGRDLDLVDLAVRVQKITDWHGRLPTAVADLLSGDRELFA
jgi:hypothetical protein